MAMRKWAGLPILVWIAGLVVLAVVVLVLLLGGGEDTQMATSPVDQGIGGKTEASNSTKGRTPARRPKPGERYVVIDTHANHIYLRTQDKVLMEAVCSTGSGDTLLDTATGRHWVFNTPKGAFHVTTKIVQPWWRKPDWAYIEEGSKPPPPSKDEERLDPAMMGDYALGFGDGYFIHGTLYERLLGVGVTHGCVRVGAEDLKELYKQVGIGTAVYVF